jgi:hypothetical protein
MAQQEISPDRFESTEQSSQKVVVAQKTGAKVASHKATNRQNAKLQNAHQTTRQSAGLKKPSSLDQMARN